MISSESIYQLKGYEDALKQRQLLVFDVDNLFDIDKLAKEFFHASNSKYIEIECLQQILDIYHADNAFIVKMNELIIDMGKTNDTCWSCNASLTDFFNKTFFSDFNKFLETFKNTI